MGKADRQRGINPNSERSETKSGIRTARVPTDYVSNIPSGMSNFSSQSHLKTSGGLMTGPIGFVSDSLAISSGNLDLTVNAASNTIPVRGDIYFTTESGVTDTLDTIDVGGTQFIGQRILLRGVTGNTITITHGSAGSGDMKGINCPNDLDYTLTGDNSVELAWDVTADKWAIVGDDGSGGAGGSLQDPIIVNENDLGTINGANNIDWSTANFHRCIVDGNTTFTMTNLPDAGKYQELVLEIKQDGTGGHTISFLDTFLNSHSPVVNTNANGVTTLAFYTYDDGTDRILGFNTNQLTSLSYALSDETTALATTSTTVPITTFRMPYSMIITEVRTSLTNASTSGLVTVDVQESGTTILSTLCSIDANETTSTTAATPAVISDGSLADDAEIKVYLTAKGTNATGLKMSLIGYII